MNPRDIDPDKISYLRQEVRRLRASLNTLTPGIEVLLRRRGFRIYKQEPSDDLLVPDREFADEYYRMLQKYSFRLFLRDVIKDQNLFSARKTARYPTVDVAEEYIEFLVRVGLARPVPNGFSLNTRPIRSFGETLEWFVAEILRREFCAEAIWGVKFRRPAVGGDYDVISKFDGSLMYIEVKSSPPKQVYETEITAFLERTADLSPEIAVFLMDTELRMKDKIVPMFENELKRKNAPRPPVERIEKELFHIGNRIFIINAKESITSNIERVFNRYFRRHA